MHNHIDLIFRANVDSSRRLIQDQYIRIRQKPPGKQYLLLVSARQVFHILIHIWRLRAQFRIGFLRRLQPIAVPQDAPMGIRLLVYDYRIVKYRQNSKDPCCPPLFCKKRDVLPDSVPGRFDLHRLPILFYSAFHDLP